MKDLTAIWISRLKKMLLLCASQLKIVKVSLVKFSKIPYVKQNYFNHLPVLSLKHKLVLLFNFQHN